MVHQEGAVLSRITTAIALFAALLVAIGAPVGHFYLMQANDTGRLQGDANVRAYLISELVSSEPDLWKFKAHVVDGILSRNILRARGGLPRRHRSKRRRAVQIWPNAGGRADGDGHKSHL